MIGPVRQIAQEGSTDKTDSSFIITFATGSINRNIYGFTKAMPYASDKGFLNRITISYLQHNYSDYKGLLYPKDVVLQKYP